MVGSRNPGDCMSKQRGQFFTQGRFQAVGAGAYESGSVHSTAQADYIRKVRKTAFEMLGDGKNLPPDGVAGHCPLGPALGQQSAYQRLGAHSKIPGKNMVRVSRTRIPAMQGKVRRLDQNRSSKNSLELRPGLKPPHA